MVCIQCIQYDAMQCVQYSIVYVVQCMYIILRSSVCIVQYMFGSVYVVQCVVCVNLWCINITACTFKVYYAIVHMYSYTYERIVLRIPEGFLRYIVHCCTVTARQQKRGEIRGGNLGLHRYIYSTLTMSVQTFIIAYKY